MIIDHDEPASYQEAMKSPNSEKWMEAIKSEMQSMYDNEVWDLIDPPEGAKVIECKMDLQRKGWRYLQR